MSFPSQLLKGRVEVVAALSRLETGHCSSFCYSLYFLFAGAEGRRNGLYGC
jgi:hypothetical protein